MPAPPPLPCLRFLICQMGEQVRGGGASRGHPGDRRPWEGWAGERTPLF